jgi:hypothetical protein
MFESSVAEIGEPTRRDVTSTAAARRGRAGAPAGGQHGPKPGGPGEWLAEKRGARMRRAWGQCVCPADPCTIVMVMLTSLFMTGMRLEQLIGS